MNAGLTQSYVHMKNWKGASDMQVNIIIPVYNTEKYLSRCLNSVLEQSCKNWRIILVNDGSTDDSGAIADAYKQKDSRISVIHKRNEGAFLARLEGIAAASGEIIMFLDSDDFWEPNCLERITGVFDKFDADVVMFPAKVIGKDGAVKFLIGAGLGEEGYLDKRIVYEKMITSHDLNSLCIKAFRRDIIDVEELKKSAGRNVRMGEDKVMLFPLLTRSNKIYYLKDVLYVYAQNGESVSQRFSASDIPAMISKEVFTTTYDYMLLWNLDDEEHRKKLGAYYLKNLMSCYYKMRRYCVEKEERKKFKEFPWKHEMGQNIGRYLRGRDFSLKEKVKLLVMRILV